MVPPSGDVDPAVGLATEEMRGPTREPWQQQRFFEGVARTLLAPRQPTLLVLDNLQWCDPDTLRFATLLLHLDHTEPILMAVTARPDVEETNNAAAAWLSGLRRADLLSEVRLHPFGADETTELARLLTGVAPDPEEATLLHDATGGFPLFVVEAARATFEAGPGKPLVATAWSQILHRGWSRPAPPRSTSPAWPPPWVGSSRFPCSWRRATSMRIAW